jgi:hypothetical protein
MLLFAMKIATCNCHSEIHKSGFKAGKSHYKITKTGRLPVCINENSGLAPSWQENYYWTHNDGGGNAELYMIDKRGYIFDTLFVNDSQNIDWEELTKDDQGHLYIGDFGNNNQARQDLTIYKHKNKHTEKITFRYADQTAYPAAQRVFDCEAFFWYKGNLYLFSKDWTNKHLTKLYVVPDKAGEYTLSPKESIFLKSPVTAADISPDGKEFALLSYGKIYTFEVTNGEINFSKPKNCIKVGRNQLEALSYTSNNDFIMTNEQRKIYTVVKTK